MFLVLIGLIVLTMYQDDIGRFFEDLKDTFGLVKREVNKPSEDEKKAVIEKFKAKYAEYVSEKNFYVYLKQVDDIMRDYVGRTSPSDGTFFNNYYVVVLPEIISVDSGKPLADQPNEMITIWAKRHMAEVPIVHNGKVYTVRTKAFLVKEKALSEVDYIVGIVLPFYSLYNLYKLKGGDKRVHITDTSYSNFVDYLTERSFELPDKIYFKGVW